MNTTKLLGESIGIQSQGIIDRTETQTRDGLTSTVIVGQFMRGRVDKPMIIHQGNIRGQLGHEPNNKFYNAVQDCLDTGVPSVQVLRVSLTQEHSISCEGATSRMYFSDFFGTWELYIDDVFQIEHKIQGVVNYIDEFFNGVLLAKAVEWRDEGEGGWWDIFDIRNLSAQPHRIKLIPAYDESFELPEVIDNPTFTEHEDGSLTFCLAPATPSQISCDGATDSISFYFNTQCEIYINDVFVGTDWTNISLWAAHGLHMPSSADNSIRLNNQTNNNIRVKLIVTGNHEYDLSDEVDNLSLTEENGVISFCLAPEQIVVPEYPYYAQVLLDRDPAYTVPPNAYVVKDFATGQEYTPTEIITASPESALYGFEIGVKTSELSVIQTLYSLVNHSDQPKLLGIKIDPPNQNYLINGLSDQLTYDASDNYWKGNIQPFPLDELSVEVIGSRLTGNITVFGRAYAPREKFPFNHMQLIMHYLNGAGQQDSSNAYMDGNNNELFISSETGVFQIEANYRGVEQNPFDVALKWGPLTPKSISHSETISYTVDDWTIKAIINGQTEYPTVLATIPDLPASFASLYTHIGYELSVSTTVDYQVSELVQSLGDSAFANVPQCSSITFFNPIPIPIGTNVFDNTNNCPIYVPAASLSTYKAALGWSAYADRIFALVGDEPWDIEYVLNGETVREVTGDPIPALYAFNQGAGRTSLIIKNTITTIGNNAFDGWTDAASLTIPDSVTSIGNNAFQFWSAATSLTIPNSITDIGFGVFSGWTSATSLVIPDSVTTIGDNAFHSWASCTSLTIPDSVTSISSTAFAGWTSATNLTLPNGVTIIENYAFHNWASCTSLTIPSSITSIDTRAFEGWESCTSITCLATTPPVLGTGVFNNTNNAPIYVPTQSVDAYKSASGWSDHASRIFAIVE